MIYLTTYLRCDTCGWGQTKDVPLSTILGSQCSAHPIADHVRGTDLAALTPEDCKTRGKWVALGHRLYCCLSHQPTTPGTEESVTPSASSPVRFKPVSEVLGGPLSGFDAWLPEGTKPLPDPLAGFVAAVIPNEVAQPHKALLESLRLPAIRDPLADCWIFRFKVGAVPTLFEPYLLDGWRNSAALRVLLQVPTGEFIVRTGFVHWMRPDTGTGTGTDAQPAATESASGPTGSDYLYVDEQAFRELGLASRNALLRGLDSLGGDSIRDTASCGYWVRFPTGRIPSFARNLQVTGAVAQRAEAEFARADAFRQSGPPAPVPSPTPSQS